MTRVVGEYFGTEPYLYHVNIWWDRYMNHEAKDSQLFHYDGEDPILLKVFFLSYRR